ncbi:TVP38/TMEM64 family inner membrane protein YdjZ [Clostridium tepidiprofundi DSM 19306]|uniref:TVP38/TMEM64 family membrane protein n=1 Tax=Clostridium tepidiprofundi DSM 19306 TaxID=1121338 RepID=A0A151B3V8_9CLOT|nr:TVP38/TMEM64 family protein [Clostridium tepidiprofundi]KYH34595.1 TVP38/TMEM64 family inner membrane protein YdjZ [Clostridium tepidiprofundi DSM 19306]
MLSKIKSFIKNSVKEYKTYIIISIFSISIALLIYFLFKNYYYIFKSPKSIQNYILKYKDKAGLVFIVIQILQVVIFAIPGEIVQIAGGYVFGTVLGTVLSVIGITIGSSIAFFISKKLGRFFVKKIISSEKVEFYEKKLSTPRFNVMIFILYLIPGIPKDALAYICGITNICFKNFIVYSTLGRIPAILLSAYFGDKINIGDKETLVTIAVAISVVFIIAIVNKDKIINQIDKRRKNRKY